jgi:hypothetical protein
VHFRRTSGQPFDVKEYGALGNDTADDFTAVQSTFAASNDVKYSAATAYKIGTTGTLGGTGKTHHFARGAKVHVTGVGVVLTIDGAIDAPHDQQIFQVDGGASLVWGPNAPREVHAAWFGATCAGGSQDDAPGINLAIAAMAQNQGRGGIVNVNTIGTGQYQIKSQIKIGASGGSQDYQGVRLQGEMNLITGQPLTTFVCAAELHSGNAVVLMTNCADCGLDSVSIDCNGFADHAFQCRSESLSGSGWGASHRNYYSRGNVAHARIYGILNGEYAIKPTITASSATFVAAGHPFVGGEQVYFRQRVAGVDTMPGGFSVDAYYLVQNVVPGVSFELGPSGGGASITPTGTFSTHLYLHAQDFGDTSQFEVDLVQFRDGGLQDYFQSSVESLGCTLRHCLGQSNGFIPAAVQVSSFNGGTNVVTLASGTITDGDLLTFVRNGSADVIPSGLAEDTIYVARDSSGATCKLAATVGGIVVPLGTIGTTGTVWSNKIIPPFYFAGGYGGTLVLEECTAAGYYEDLFVSGQPSSAGMGLTARSFQSQSWRMAHVTNEGRTLFPQAGGFALLNCQHATIVGGGIVSGSRASVIWDLASANTTNLVVLGGSCNRDLFNKNSSTAAISVLNTNLYAYGGGGGTDFQATMRGTLNATSFWSESGVYKTVARNLSTIGPATIGDGTSIVTLDAHSGNYVNVKAIDVYADVTAWHMRQVGGAALADWTNPGGAGVVQLESFGSLTLKGDNGATVDAGTGGFLGKSNSITWCDSNANLLLHAPNGALFELGTADGNGTGYFSCATLNIRHGTGAAHTSFTQGSTSSDSTWTCALNLQVVAGSIKQTISGHDRFLVDSGGQVALFGGSTGPKPTITGVLSSVTDANAKAVLTSIIAALVQIDAAINGTT